MFGRKNTFLGEESEVLATAANKKVELLILRQLPSLFLKTKTLYGIKFDRVEVKQDKLIIELAGIFEAVFLIDFKATGFG